MDKKQFKKTIEVVKKNSPKRKFTQSFDLIITLKDINLKDPSQHVDSFVQLHHSKGRKTKICALIGAELESQAKENCDFYILSKDFPKYAKDKKLTKKLAKDYDFFVAQANLMGDVAKTFGRVFGPKGKMPNPQAGCVVPPSANLAALKDKLGKTVRVTAKTSPSIQVIVGNEDMPDEEVLDNLVTIFNNVVHHLPSERNNIKNVLLKLTMGKSFKVGADEPVEATETKVSEAKVEEKVEAPAETAESEEEAATETEATDVAPEPTEEVKE